MTTFKNFHHPYTEGLLLSIPAYGGTGSGCARSPAAAEPHHMPPGCPFTPRCPYVMDRCRAEVPPLAPAGGGRPPVSLLAAAQSGARQALRVKLGQTLPVSAEA